MPTDWQARYESGDTPWDKGAPCPELDDYLAANPIAGRVLVPGCGSGHDARAFAAAGADVLGIDLAPGAIRWANSFPKSGRESYRQADFLDLPDDLVGAFDWVWEHTLFCAIDIADRQRYVASAAKALRPGGHLLGIFYIDPDHPPGTPPHRVSVDELDALFGSAFQLERQWRPTRAYPGREGRELMRLMAKR